jgi:hypothetical protein
MNRSPNKSKRDIAPEDRELFVIHDFATIPAAELRPMTGSFSQWHRPIYPTHVAELKRWVKGDSEHISKRIMRRFDELRGALERLTFFPAFYANIPCVGPCAQAVMGMSRRDGTLHAMAFQSTAQVDRKMVDEGYFGFTSWLTDGTSVVTFGRVLLPTARAPVNQLVIASDDIELVLKKHRERVRLDIQTVAPHELFDRAEADNRLTIEDLVKRNVIRLATPGEVARIRNQG